MVRNQKKQKVALFPCKANPPHLGHILTLLKLKDDYDKIIIDVLDVKLLISADESIVILKKILNYIPGKFEYNKHKRSYIYEYPEKIPKCDEVVTGNIKLYNKMIKQGINVRLIERTPIYKGELIRKAYNKKSLFKNSKDNSFKIKRNKKTMLEKIHIINWMNSLFKKF